MSLIHYMDFIEMEDEAYASLVRDGYEQGYWEEVTEDESQEEVATETVMPLKITIPTDPMDPTDPIVPDLATTLLVCAGALSALTDCSVNDAKRIVINLLHTNIRLGGGGYSMSLYNLDMLLSYALCYEAAGNIKEFWNSIHDAALYATQKYEDAMTGPEPEYECDDYDDYDDMMEYKYDYDY